MALRAVACSTLTIDLKKNEIDKAESRDHNAARKSKSKTRHISEGPRIIESIRMQYAYKQTDCLSSVGMINIIDCLAIYNFILLL